MFYTLVAMLLSCSSQEASKPKIEKPATPNTEDKNQKQNRDSNLARITSEVESAVKSAINDSYNKDYISRAINGDINAVDEAGYTALGRAAEYEDFEGVQSLITNSANPNARNTDGKTPLMLASKMRDNEKIIEYLLQHKADINAVDENGKTALKQAIMSANNNVALQLIAAKADVNIADQNGYTPLMLAVMFRKYLIKPLIKAGANVAAVNKDGNTALQMATNEDELAILNAALATQQANNN